MTVTDDQTTSVLDGMLEGMRGNSKVLAKKRQILEMLGEGATVRELCDRFEFSQNAYYLMRRQDPVFADACSQIADVSRMSKGKFSEGRRFTFDPDRPMPDKADFAAWRLKYIGRTTSPFGQAIADAICDPTSSVVIIHGPPGGGKDTTVCDALLYLKCDDRTYLRCAYINETENQAMRRVGERIAPYLTDPAVYRVAPGGPGSRQPTGSLIDDYGPFQWDRGMKYPDGTVVARTTWTKHELRFLQSASAPEQDPDLWATGMSGALYGSRVGLMIFSDLFTRENQRQPTQRDAGFDWVVGTADSRLDTEGRLVMIHTRVGPDDNQGRLIDHYVADAHPYETTVEGPITTVRYTNGTTVVTCVAIWTDENGDEQSFDPDRFPLDDQWKLPDGSTVPLATISQQEARERGLSRVKGLRTIRAKDPDWFETAYQQNPQRHSDLVDFTDTVLDRALDPSRSYGVIYPHEWKILAVDPARAGWAAWALLAVDLEAETVTLADYRVLRRLGIPGIKQQLIIQPATQYDPTYLSYETNHESGVLYDTEVQDVIRSLGITVVDHYTNKNRMDPEIGVASMASWMIRGQMRFPNATAADKAKTLVVRQHFKNWDANPQRTRRQHKDKEARPDDLAMAIWPGWIWARQLIDRGKARHDQKQRKATPRAVMARWRERSGPDDPVSELRANRAGRGYRDRNVNLTRLYLGGSTSDESH